jgi:PEP-CTERM motif
MNRGGVLAGVMVALALLLGAAATLLRTDMSGAQPARFAPPASRGGAGAPGEGATGPGSAWFAILDDTERDAVLRIEIPTIVGVVGVAPWRCKWDGFTCPFDRRGWFIGGQDDPGAFTGGDLSPAQLARRDMGDPDTYALHGFDPDAGLGPGSSRDFVQGLFPTTGPSPSDAGEPIPSAPTGIYPVPEPTSFALFGAALLLGWSVGRRRPLPHSAAVRPPTAARMPRARI